MYNPAESIDSQELGGGYSEEWTVLRIHTIQGWVELMAKIVQSLTRASKEYEQRTFQSLVRDLDNVINKLNTTFQDEIKQEVEAKSFFLE